LLDPLGKRSAPRSSQTLFAMNQLIKRMKID
jgi:hypothetical protein